MSMFKLDLYEYYYLDKKPRFTKTKTLLSQKKKHLKDNIKNSVKYNKNFLIPLGLEIEVAKEKIEELQLDIFDKKVYNALVQLKRGLKKINKGKKFNDDDIKCLKEINDDQLIKSKVIKIVGKIFTELENHPFIKADWIINGLNDKTNEFNPSCYHSSLDQKARNTISKVFNTKEIKKVIDGVELSFKLILGPVVADKKNAAELKKIEKESGMKDEKEEVDSDEKEDTDDEEHGEQDHGAEENFDFNEEDFAQFDSLVGDSEGEEDEDVQLDGDIDYNQVTDEEPSDNESEEGDEEDDNDDDDEKDDFFVEELVTKKEKKEKKEKHKLPELAVGYYSGDEDDDTPKKKLKTDKLVEEITKPTRKNRRGQRERQKIWEMKYGRGANHVKKEKEEKEQMRQQKQKEWEERERKRKQKAMENGEYASGGNSAPLGERGSGAAAATPASKPLHPSWEAKMKQKQLSNVKFEGKKKTFD